MKYFYDLMPKDLLDSGWRLTRRGEWTHDYFGERGNSGLCFSFGVAKIYEGFIRYRIDLLEEQNEQANVDAKKKS